MMQLLQTQRELVANGLGPGSEQQMVTLKNIYNVTRDLIVNWGHRNTADYITDPSDQDAERDPVKEPQPGKDELDHQAKMKELDIKEKEGKADSMKKDAEIRQKDRELDLKEREIRLEEYRVGLEKAEAQKQSRMEAANV